MCVICILVCVICILVCYLYISVCYLYISVCYLYISVYYLYMCECYLYISALPLRYDLNAARALYRTQLLPVTHVLVYTWMLTVQPVYEL